MASEAAALDLYMAKAQQAYEEAFGELQDLSGWETIKTGNNFFALKKYMSGGLAALKIDAYIPKSTKTVVSRLYGHFAEFSAELIPDMYESEVCLKEFNGSAKLTHSRTKAPAPGVSPRDAVYFGVLLEVDDGSFALVETSVVTPEMPPQPDYVRSQLRYSLHTFEKLDSDEDKTHVLVISLIDPQGNLPVSLVNLGLGRRAEFYEKVMDKAGA